MDLEVLKTSARWLDEGRRALLVIVVKTSGSSPRPEGAMLAVRDDGIEVGSVSGGCIEEDLIARVRANCIAANARPETVKYGVTAEEAHRFGLPCAGTIQLVAEPLRRNSGIAELCVEVEARRLITHTMELARGRVTLTPGQATDGLAFDGKRLVTINGQCYRTLVIGAGQLSRYLCRIAVGLGYQVTACDPRDDYVRAWDVPGTRVVHTMPDDTVLEMRLDACSAPIVLTH